MLAIADNPPALPPGVENIRELRGQWWIAHTKAKMERVLVRHFIQYNVGYFLPLLERVTVSSGKKRRSLAPMFPSYVFFCGDDSSRYQALATNYLCQAIDVTLQEQLIDELVGIEKAVKGKAQLELYPFTIVGQRCRVRAGHFEGLEGVVVESPRGARLVLQVSMLGRGASLEIDLNLLEPIS